MPGDGIQNRRTMDGLLKEGIESVDNDVIKIKTSVLSMIIIIILQFAYMIWWAAEIDAKVETIASIQNNVTTILTVLTNHGTEMGDIRTEQDRLSGLMDGIQAQIRVRTEDRFKKREFTQWKNEHMEYLKERFRYLQKEIDDYAHDRKIRNGSITKNH